MLPTMIRTPVEKTTSGKFEQSQHQKYEDVMQTPASTRRLKWWDLNSQDVGPLTVFKKDEWKKYVEEGKNANQTDRRAMYEKAKEAFHHYVRHDVDPAVQEKLPLQDICRNLRRLEYRSRYIYDLMAEGKQATDTDQRESEHIKEITDGIKEQTYIQIQDQRRKKKEQGEDEKTRTLTDPEVETSQMPLEPPKQAKKLTLEEDGGPKELGAKLKPTNPLNNETIVGGPTSTGSDSYFEDSHNEELIGSKEIDDQIDGKINRFLVELEHFAASQGSYRPRSELVSLLVKTKHGNLEDEEEEELSLLLRAFSKKRMEEALIVWSRETKNRTEKEFQEITHLLKQILEHWDKLVSMEKDNTREKMQQVRVENDFNSDIESPYPQQVHNRTPRRLSIPRFPGIQDDNHGTTQRRSHSTPFERLRHPTEATNQPSNTGNASGGIGSGEQNFMNQLGQMFGSFANMINKNKQQSSIKLPPLKVGRFNGEILEFASFWESYNPLVHSNPDLSDDMKLLRLKASLTPEVEKTLYGSSGENLSYRDSMAIIFEKYCNADHVTYVLKKKLKSVAPPTSKADISGIRRFVDEARRYMTNLQLWNVFPEDYATIIDDFRESIPKALQYDLADQCNRQLSHLSLTEFLEAMSQYASLREDTDRIHKLSNSNATSTPRLTTMATTQQHSQSKAKRPCLFCNQVHFMADCHVIKDPLERFRFFKRNGMCTACTSKAHNFRQCTNTRRCWGTKGNICRQHHHTSLHAFFANRQQRPGWNQNTRQYNQSQGSQRPQQNNSAGNTNQNSQSSGNQGQQG